MNTTSNPRRLFAGMAAAAALAACIQGPWDYYPENPPLFKGLYLTGYALAGKPFRHVCFERLLKLDEEATQAFPFYDSADVRIAGRFQGAPDTLALTPIDTMPNCFQGDPLSLPERGESYALTARISWDSAGRKVTSVLTATANVPKDFKLHDSASAPGFAETGGIPDTILTRKFLGSLSPATLQALLEAFPEAGPLLTTDGFDTTAAFRAYIAANGKRIQDKLMELLDSKRYVYGKGDTAYYLNGVFNTQSHYFSADRSGDVKGVLITQRFEDSSARPESNFDSPLGVKPDSSEYYFPGSIRSLLIYPDAKGRQGYNLLDSMGVVNVWFHTLWNRLYFYGFEQAYYSYTSTVLENGGDPRIKPKYNVTGGRGIFAGAIPDSFDVYIKADSLTKTYPLRVTHGLFCQDEGWMDSKDCRQYYRSYCSERDWKPADCGEDAIAACLEADLDADSALKARCAPAADSARRNAALAERAKDRFCVERGFPEDGGVCAGAAQRCLETAGANACKRTLWDYCLDHAWSASLAQCAPGLASYCHDRPRLSETLCKHADGYCGAHQGSVLCK
ncbi:MAG TPA: hypothetical protein VJ385_12465 [Fibrobacteria bacterium]|nr:hypothetical protein [Fibrobacteria bacterium]